MSNISKPKPIIDMPNSDVVITGADGAGVPVTPGQDVAAATQGNFIIFTVLLISHIT